jgi:hypothetical protein
MINVQTSKRSLSRWFATALVALLFASSGIVYAQKDKNKSTATTTPAPAPAKSAPAAAPAARSAPPARSAPTSAPAGRSAPPANRPGAISAPANTGRGTPANQPGRPPVANQPGRPAVTNQPGSPAANQPGRTSGNQPGRTFGNQPGNPAANQPGRTFGNQPGNPTAHQPGQPPMGNQPGRPAVVNRPGPRPEFHGSNGSSAHFAPSGRPTVVRTAGGATIAHAPSGAQRIEVVRPGGRVIVTNAAGHGYMQRSINVRGQALVQRTYYVHGAAYPRFYRAQSYRGMTFAVYTPVRFYSPRFYAWGYTPWGAPVYYNFGFAANPWYGFYGGYFTPYPAYAGPNYWLTDYMLANSLQEGYQEHMDAGATAQGGYDPSGQTPVSPYVKNLVAGEVQRQLVQESTESQNAAQNATPASNGAPPIFADNNPHVFVVSSSLIANTGSQECALTHGDVLQLNPAPSADPSFANVQVLASKGQDCQAGNLIPVQLADLQEMQNHMRETVDLGLGELQTRQGQGGLPTIEVAMRTQTAAPYAAELPPAEPNAANELWQQAQEADRQEQDVLGQAGPIAAPPASAAPPTIELGQTIADVVARMGQPVRIADLGQKKTYYYKDMKVIFVDGKVNDVQ